MLLQALKSRQILRRCQLHDYVLDKRFTVIMVNLQRPAAVFSVFFVYLLSALGIVLWSASPAAFPFWCSAAYLIHYGTC